MIKKRGLAMRVYFNFKLDDGIKTENFREDDIDTLDEKVSKYDITSYDLERLFFKPVKSLIECAYPVNVSLRNNDDEDNS
ncbi:hypothetical protein R9X47_02645 [Wukongibacter baidiensis]|uniref:hypothetical protein n=1 Tax=Wukongibacter baidiensis TaxID=1723361 RepID=UPI003D7F1E8B